MPSSHSLKAYFGLAAILGGLALFGTADAQQSRLPACPADQSVRYHNCWGAHTWPSGRRYVGAFQNDKRHGHGTFTWPDGRRYEGEWRDDKFSGLGIEYAQNGSVKNMGLWAEGLFIKTAHVSLPVERTSNIPHYIGDYKDDKRHGQGAYTWPDGEKYIGEWRDDKRHGQGTNTWPNGRQHVGEYRNGWANGQGNLTWPDGMKYIGEFKDSRPFGHGVLQWSDGRKYVGLWNEGKHHGLGTLFAADGTVVQTGIWAGGEFVRFASVPASAPPAPPPPAAPKSSSGSAFRIANGQFVTNHHVVDGCTILKIDGNSGGRVVASDPTRDLALVSIANDSGPIASIRTTRIQLNESITAAGFPLDGAFTGIAITNGTISRLSGLRGDTGEVQISAPVQPGNSGGPLLDVAGNVIGVVSSKLNALKAASLIGDVPQNVNFAINGAALRAFLDAKSVNYKEVSNERELTGVQIAARASAFTVLIECRQ